MGVLLRFFNLSQPTMKVLFFVALAIALSWQCLRPIPRLNPQLMLIPQPGTDITTVVIPDITEDTEDTTDGADTTDTPTDTDTVTLENAPLMLNPKLPLKPHLKLMLMPLPGIMVDTMDTPDTTDTDTVWDMDDTMVDTTVWDTVDTGGA